MKAKKTIGKVLATAVLFIWGSMAFIATPIASAQTPSGEPPLQEQAVQNNTRMLNSVRANPQAKIQALERLKERMTTRGLTDIDTRLIAIWKIFDEAVALTPADFEKNRQQLVSRIMAQMRAGGDRSAAGGGAASGGTDALLPSGAGTTKPSENGAVARPANAIPWIDVHNHLLPGKGRDFRGAFSAALALMDQIGISKMIVMCPPQNCDRYDYATLVAALQPYSARFASLGGGESLNVMLQQAGKQTVVSASLKQQFRQKAEEILRKGAVGFGEMAAHHLSLHAEDHPYESVPADHPLLLLLADIAAQHDVPMDIHFDVVTNDIPVPGWLNSPNNPKVLPANLEAFERLLDHNPKTKICWAHVGSDNTGHWTVTLSRLLLQKHPNLFMSLRLGPGHAPDNFPLTPDRQIKPAWLQLFKDFPTRFVIGSDNFIASASFDGNGTAAMLAKRVPMTRALTPVFLNALPRDLARKIASENAMALYKLKN